MTVDIPFQTVFAVPMTCESCVKDVSGALHQLKGINTVDVNLQDQLVSIEGTAPPSAIVEAIQSTGRDAILRGSGASNSAAVSILETFHRKEEAQPHDHSHHDDDQEHDRDVRGLARMVQVSPEVTLVDLTLRGVAPGTYRASIREYGNLAEGAASTGPVWRGEKSGSIPRGALGTVVVGEDRRGNAFLESPFKVWEIIGHAMVVSRQDERDGRPLKNDEDTVVGVVARSAGVWDNDKTVCSCTGKTLWEERKDEVKKGML
ncbi:Cu,Zn superoxide dismutase-like protein [Coniochaeta ligniaria NRRL 30616]|uniref:Superoxide dismutase 1 copper chaperone n=1 Tax=Coniochaeta ligniaria NRRL 30616 TaxID=1408157 RepID=A0A1J7JL62_9PEZI|nr:Cu,Zn superoxide dismutase-like protein [Coniochaeta ligniaria NRRL 30616]